MVVFCLFVCFSFWENPILSFIATVPFYVPTNSIRMFQYLHILTNIYLLLFFLLDNSHLSDGGGATLWFWFAFYWWLAIFVLFHIPVITCMYSLEKYLFKYFTLCLNRVVVPILLNSRSYLYILEINPIWNIWFSPMS